MPWQQDNVERSQAADSWLDNPATFGGVEFDCHVDSASLKFNGHGALLVTFVIPPGQVDKALPLRHLIRSQIPVTVSINPTEAFLRLVESQASAG